MVISESESFSKYLCSAWSLLASCYFSCLTGKMGKNAEIGASHYKDFLNFYYLSEPKVINADQEPFFHLWFHLPTESQDLPETGRVVKEVTK